MILTLFHSSPSLCCVWNHFQIKSDVSDPAAGSDGVKVKERKRRKEKKEKDSDADSDSAPASVGLSSLSLVSEWLHKITTQ
jgi:hypothetical protein